MTTGHDATQRCLLLGVKQTLIGRRRKTTAVNGVNHAHSIAMSERPVITAQLIVAVASRRCALITVTAANNAAVTQNISLSGIIITLTRDYPQEIRPHKAA